MDSTQKIMKEMMEKSGARQASRDKAKTESDNKRKEAENKASQPKEVKEPEIKAPSPPPPMEPVMTQESEIPQETSVADAPSEEPQNCPKCGCPPLIMHKSGQYVVECRNDCCYITQDDRDEAIKAWNRQ